MNKELELLVITMEECGELTQACSKHIRFGNNKEKKYDLTDEAGDVLCMINLLIEYGLIDRKSVEDRATIKLSKLKTWSSLFI